jgi:hypothetical protein
MGQYELAAAEAYSVPEFGEAAVAQPNALALVLHRKIAG